MHSGFSLLRATGALALSCSAGAAQAQVIATLSPAQPAVGRGDNVLVTITLTNTSDTVRHLLRWRTPQQDLEAPLFEVQRDGQPVRYLGRRIKRAAPGPADYLQLAPGAALTHTVELSRFYEMRVTGSYTIRYRSPALHAPDTTAGAVVGELASNAVTIRLEGSSTPILQANGAIKAQIEESPNAARLRWQKELSPKSFHSVIFASSKNHRQVTAYDLSIGSGKAVSDPTFYAYLCAVADWRLKIMDTDGQPRDGIFTWDKFLTLFHAYLAGEPNWRKQTIEGNAKYYSRGVLPEGLPLLTGKLWDIVISETISGARVMASQSKGKS